MFLTKDNSAIKLLKFQGLVAYKNVLSGFKYKEWNLKMKISKKRKVSDIIEKDTELIT